MTWRANKEYLDKRTAQHVVVLEDPESETTHHVVVLVGHASCPTCGHVTDRTPDTEFDPKTRVAEEMALLQASHDAMENYARKHGVQVLQPNGKTRAAR